MVLNNVLKIAGVMTLMIISVTLLGGRQYAVEAQNAPSAQGGDALWHLPQFGQQGWFIHANNGRVRVCNVSKASVVGDRPGPRCSNWE